LYAIYIISAVTEFFNIEEFSLLKEYKNYVDIFSINKAAKYNKLKDMKYSINLISEKNLLYKLIYNLSV
jgi:hypothetical protein